MKKMGKMKKKSSHSAVIKSPGRWTGNNFFLKGGLKSRPIHVYFQIFLKDRQHFTYHLTLCFHTEVRPALTNKSLPFGMASDWPNLIDSAMIITSRTKNTNKVNVVIT